MQSLYGQFQDYAFLWQKDVNQTFEEFLKGYQSPMGGRTSPTTAGTMAPSNLRVMASARSSSRYEKSIAAVELEIMSVCFVMSRVPVIRIFSDSHILNAAFAMFTYILTAVLIMESRTCML